MEQAVEAFNCNETVEITEIEEVNEESIPSEEKSGAEAVKTGDSATVPPPEKVCKCVIFVWPGLFCNILIETIWCICESRTCYNN